MDTLSHSPNARADDSAEWHALVDGRLQPAQAQALHQLLEGDENAQDTIAHWKMQRARLRELHQDMLLVPVPDDLLASALRAAGRREQQAQWWRWSGMAASVLIAFVLGWTGRSEWARHAPGRAPAGTAAVLASAPGQRFAQQAAVAHAVYQPEVRHPVEVTAAQQDHLVQWLSKRLDRPLKVPALAAQGYELVGGRLLPGDTGARAQFMYQNGAGQRITLYLGALAVPTSTMEPTASDNTDAPVPNPSAPTNTTFQFTQDGPVTGFYWADKGFGYALSGQLPRPELLNLATVAYQQLQR